MTTYRKAPAYGNALLARRKLGERIGLLIVAVHDNDLGRELAARSGTARVLVHETTLPHELDWTCAVALDCLICDCDETLLYATATMLFAAGAASIWAQFDEGIFRLERYRSDRRGFIAPEWPVAPGALGRAIQAHRQLSLLRREGVYGAPIFDGARDELLASIFGPLADKAKAWLQRGQARAA